MQPARSKQNANILFADWNPVTKEDAASGNSWVVYAAAKKFAEQAVWEWAEQHPHVDVTTRMQPLAFLTYPD